MKRKENSKGFTLIELMIVVVIVAILVGLALPSYSRYVLKANRGEAQALLLNWANNQEVWRANDTGYATIAQLVPPTHDKYNFTLPVRTTTTYTLTATAQDDQANDEDKGTPCTVLTLDQSNDKGPANCW